MRKEIKILTKTIYLFTLSGFNCKRVHDIKYITEEKYCTFDRKF